MSLAEKYDRVIGVAQGKQIGGYADNQVRTAKFTWWNFVPKFIFQELTEVSVLFFILSVVVNSIPGIQIITPITSVLPLVFIVLVAGIRELLEDARRHKNDKETNFQPLTVFSGNEFLKMYSKDVQVGDIIMINQGDTLPADILLLGAFDGEDPTDKAYIHTASLDGETNLKERVVPHILKDLDPFDKVEEVDTLLESRKEYTNPKTKYSDIVVLSEQPSPSILEFGGLIFKNTDEADIFRYKAMTDEKHKEWEEYNAKAGKCGIRGIYARKKLEKFPSKAVIDRYNDVEAMDEPDYCSYSPNNVLLRGSRLQFPTRAIGTVLYAGKDSKLFMNMTPAQIRRPYVTKILNMTIGVFILFIVIVIAIFSVIAVNAVPKITASTWLLHGIPVSEDPPVSSITSIVFKTIGSYFILLSYAAPISLFVGLELARFIQARLIEADKRMEVKERGKEAQPIVRNSVMNESLGTIQYVVSDKTGTLTKNIMKLRYLAFPDVGVAEVIQRKSITPPATEEQGEPRLQPRGISEVHVRSPSNGPGYSLDTNGVEVSGIEIVEGSDLAKEVQKRLSHGSAAAAATATIGTNKLADGHLRNSSSSFDNLTVVKYEVGGGKDPSPKAKAKGRRGKKNKELCSGLLGSGAEGPPAKTTTKTTKPTDAPRVLNTAQPSGDVRDLPDAKVVLRADKDLRVIGCVSGVASPTSGGMSQMGSVTDEESAHEFSCSGDENVIDLFEKPCTMEGEKRPAPTREDFCNFFQVCACLNHSIILSAGGNKVGLETFLAAKVPGGQCAGTETETDINTNTETDTSSCTGQQGHIEEKEQEVDNSDDDNGRTESGCSPSEIVLSERYTAPAQNTEQGGEPIGEQLLLLPPPLPQDIKLEKILKSFPYPNQYNGESSDECAFVMASSQLHYTLVASSGGRIVIEENQKALDNVTRARGNTEQRRHVFTIVGMLPFNSDRMRMSVVVREELGYTDTASREEQESDPPFVPTTFVKPGRHFVIVKGADSKMVPLVLGQNNNPNNISNANSLNDFMTATLDMFSIQGLRTLVFCYRELPQKLFRLPPTGLNFKEDNLEAIGDCLPTLFEAHKTTISQEHKSLLEARIETLIEPELSLVAISAVEDELQDNVPKVLKDLKKAGIHIWMLTGDKMSTAINIAKACKIINNNDTVIPISGDSLLKKNRAADEKENTDEEQIRLLMNKLLRLYDRLVAMGNSENPTKQQQESLRLLKGTSNRKLINAKKKKENAIFAQMLSEYSRSTMNFNRMSRAFSGAFSFNLPKMDDNVDPSEGGVEAPAKFTIKIVPDETEDSDDLFAAADENGEASLSFPILAIDRRVLELVQMSSQLELLFFRIAPLLPSVLFTRSSPSQKAYVVHTLVHKINTCVLAIGDGGNDAPMIKEANVGVGIAGREGLQASKVADYSIGEFQCLKYLLLKHGRTAFLRIATLIKYSIYKGILLCVPPLMYSSHSMYTGDPLYQDINLTFYNITLTFLPIFLLSFMEMDMPNDLVMKFPQSYAEVRSKHLLNVASILLWTLEGVYTGFVLFMLSVYYIASVGGSTMLDGNTADYSVLSNSLTTLNIIVVNLRIMLECKSWTKAFIVCIVISVVAYVFDQLLLEFSFVLDYLYYGVSGVMLSNPAFYICLVMTISFTTIPIILIKFIRERYVPKTSSVVLRTKKEFDNTP